MVDSIELVARNEANKMGKLHRDRSGRFEEQFQTLDEVVDIGHVSEHVIGDDEITLSCFFDQSGRGVRSKKPHHRWDTFIDCRARDVSRWLDPEDWNI